LQRDKKAGLRLFPFLRSQPAYLSSPLKKKAEVS
jgi:hypothetical protein